MEYAYPHATTRLKAWAQIPALLCLVLFLTGALFGCAGQQATQTQDPAAHTNAQGTKAHNTDAQNTNATALHYSADFTYAAPAAETAGTGVTATPGKTGVTATPGKTGGTATPPASAASPVPPELMKALNAASLLHKLRGSPPDDLQGLEFRIDKDEAEALRLLHAFGYYDGSVQRSLSPAGQGEQPHAAASAAVTANTATADAAASAPITANTATADAAASPRWRVVLTLTPGPRYTVGETVVHYADADANANTETLSPNALPNALPNVLPNTLPHSLPRSLMDAGLTPGSPVEAARILRVVERLPEILGQRGYPLAEVQDTRYAVDKASKQLFATVLVRGGPQARMGRVVVQGDSSVEPAYLEKLTTWQKGMTWDQRYVEDYRDLLVRQGLFRSIDLKAQPAQLVPSTQSAQSTEAAQPTEAAPSAEGHAEPLPPDILSRTDNAAAQTSLSAPAAASPPAAAHSVTPIYDLVVTVADAPQRTVGGGVNYESNRGPGVQAYWEHRNLLGQGERFRAETSIWQDSQFARATFRKPSFFDKSQEFIAEAWLRNEDSIAYTQRAAWLSAGVERRLWKSIFASAGVSVEGGDLEDPTHPRRGYTMTSLPLTMRYEGASNLSGGGSGSSTAQLDPERGFRASLGVRPTWGTYGSDFTVTPTRFTFSGYWPLGSVARSDDAVERIPRTVVAVRGAAGTLWRGDSQRIPAAARYYGGGGGSVRGYAYQSLGPQDVHGDPLGGASFAELSLEARVRISENIAIVPFLDGGNVYSGVTPGTEKDGRTTGLQWGAGLGLRYHTAVGPLRLDVATPLNPRKDDAPFFLYISIGQSF